MFKHDNSKHRTRCQLKAERKLKLISGQKKTKQNTAKESPILSTRVEYANSSVLIKNYPRSFPMSTRMIELKKCVVAVKLPIAHSPKD